MTATLPDLERMYAEAVSAAWIALPLDRDPNFNEQDHVHGAGLLAVYRAGQNKWVSVEERLPNGDGDVLCLSIRGTVHVVTASTVRQSYTAGVAISEACWITHWQPLPEPPQSVTETQGE